MSRRLGKPFLPHQREMFDVLGEIDPQTGLLAYDTVVLIGPRQATGKSESILTACTYRCTAFDAAIAAWSREMFGVDVPDPGPQRVIYAAQNADEARLKWRREYLPRLQESSYRDDFEAMLQTNREVFLFTNGSSWSPVSQTKKTGGTGGTTDMTVIDEAWAQGDSSLELAMRPTMMTRPWRQSWVASMIPGPSRAAAGTWPYLAGKREVGRARVEADVRYGTAFFDFSAPEDADPGDPATWWQALPGLGYTVSEATIRSDYETALAGGATTLADFCAEYLGWEPKAGATKWMTISRETWQVRCFDPDSRIEPGSGTRAFAIEMNKEGTRGWIGAAGRRPDGHWHVEVVEPGGAIPQETLGVEWMLTRAVELNAKWRPSTFVIVKDRPASVLIPALKARGIPVLTPNPTDVAAACVRFARRTGEESLAATDDAPMGPWEGLFHLGQRELDGGVAAAIKFEHGDGLFTFVQRGAESGHLASMYTVILAMHGHEVKGRVRAKSKIW